MFSIIIPAYNEEKAISQTIKDCLTIIHDIGNSNSEIIVVDDCSSDNTFEIANKYEIKTIHHPHNMGYGRSLKDGIRLAANDMIIITDADGTYPINQIPVLLEEYKKGFDMIVGARKGKHYRESFLKKRYRFLLRKVVEYTAGRKIQDINSGLRVFSKKEALRFINTLCNTFSFTTSLTLAFMMNGKYVKYIPIPYEKRIGETKVKLFKDTLRTLQYIVEAILYYNPIKLFILLSSLLFIASAISLIIAFFSEPLIFYIIGLGCFFMSILVFCIGLIAVQLKQLIKPNL